MAGTKESNIKIPTTKEDITPSWVQEVTGHSVLEENFSLEGDIQEGNGVLSSVVRVSYNISDGSRKSIIVKLLPTDEKMLEFTLADKMDEREIKFYSTVLPDLLEVVPEIKENVCLVYNGTVRQGSEGSPKASMLVMEDLTALGFRMMHFSGENSEEAVRVMLTFMARLHYGAYAVQQRKGVPLPKLYPFMQGITHEDDAKWLNQMETMCEGAYTDLDELLVNHSISPEVRRKFQMLKPCSTKMVNKIVEKGRINQCLIHADMWPPNIQVHDSLPVKILDWQTMGYRDVTFDLSIMLCTLLPKEKLTKAKLTECLRQYYTEFESLCEKGGLQDRIPRRSWEEFEEFFFTWGIAFLYVSCLPFLNIFTKDLPKYANLMRFMCEQNHLPEFLLRECSS